MSQLDVCKTHFDLSRYCQIILCIINYFLAVSKEDVIVLVSIVYVITFQYDSQL